MTWGFSFQLCLPLLFVGSPDRAVQGVESIFEHRSPMHKKFFVERGIPILQGAHTFPVPRHVGQSPLPRQRSHKTWTGSPGAGAGLGILPAPPQREHRPEPAGRHRGHSFGFFSTWPVPLHVGQSPLSWHRLHATCGGNMGEGLGFGTCPLPWQRLHRPDPEGFSQRGQSFFGLSTLVLLAMTRLLSPFSGRR